MAEQNGYAVKWINVLNLVRISMKRIYRRGWLNIRFRGSRQKKQRQKRVNNNE